MSTRQEGAPSRPIASRADLIEAIAAGAKPKARWRIGTEHEKFVFWTDTLASAPYDGPRGIRALLGELMRRYGWQPIQEGDTVIALRRPPGEGIAAISLEPAGQLELSGAPLETLHETAAETRTHLDQVRAIGADLGLGMLGLGFHPLARREDMPRMPKRRYAVMTRYMPTVGAHGLDMMYRTSTIQVNLDFADEADMVKKLRVGLALQPLATALFAASPLTEGRLNGFKSMRSEVWRDTDRRRTGMLPFVFEPGMGYDAYVEYALDVPMYFVYRDGHYIDVAGASFRDFLAGRLAALPGERPLIDDWADHLTTLFPEVRLKRYLEMRGADSGPAAHIPALSALWVGLLYDQTALDAAWDLVKDWSADERQGLRDSVPKGGLATTFGRLKLADIAREALRIARAGLAARGRRDGAGNDETIHLAPIEARLASGRTVADEVIDQFNGPWGGRAEACFKAWRM